MHPRMLRKNLRRYTYMYERYTYASSWYRDASIKTLYVLIKHTVRTWVAKILASIYIQTKYVGKGKSVARLWHHKAMPRLHVNPKSGYTHKQQYRQEYWNCLSVVCKLHGKESKKVLVILQCLKRDVWLWRGLLAHYVHHLMDSAIA